MSVMTTIAGIPAHALWVHLIVVLMPATALLEIVCALWPAVRRRLVWLVVVMAALLMVTTPISVDAGEWLYGQEKHHTALLQTHVDRGEQLTYYAAALLVVAVALAVLHWRQSRSGHLPAVATITIAVVAVVVGVASTVAVVRTGDPGARSVWHASSLTPTLHT
jgi:ABC-type branched-subunit amino acid transport system permease subunit